MIYGAQVTSTPGAPFREVALGALWGTPLACLLELCARGKPGAKSVSFGRHPTPRTASPARAPVARGERATAGAAWETAPVCTARGSRYVH